MNTTLSKAVFLSGVLLAAAPAWTHVAPAQAPLPNLDTRATTSANGARSLMVTVPAQFDFSPAQRSAIDSLRNRVPTLQVSHGPFTRSPRLVSAERGFLTGPNGVGGGVNPSTLATFAANDRHRVVRAFLTDNQALFGHGAEALDTATIKREYVTAHNGLRTVIWEQQHAGIPVFEGLLTAHITRKGELARVTSHFLMDPLRAANRGAANGSAQATSPRLGLAEAVAVAAQNVGTELSPSSVEAMQAAAGAELKSRVRAPGLNGDVYGQLVWVPLDPDTMRLAWQVIFVSQARKEMFRSLVDGQTGQVLVRHNLTRYQAAPQAIPATYSVYTSDSPSPFSPGWSTPQAQPQPPVVPRTTLTNLVSLSASASPSGWVSPADPLTGAYTTVGNNVDAHTDMDDDDVADLPRPTSTDDPPVFDFLLDLGLPPTQYTNASVVNLFYLNNFMHDKLYDLGFTEAAGNFQNLNFGRGGLEGDAVQADGLDGAALNDFQHRNNANFYPPPDGIPGRMQMYMFDGPDPDRDGSLDSEVVCHEYTHGLTDRLVGGGVGISALQTAGMAEGWSDFYPLCLFSEASDDPRACYPAGGYASYLLFDLQDNYYYGIRRYPYCTDMDKNPLTFKDIDPTQADAHFGIPSNPIYGIPNSYPEEVHFQGEVWCTMLWEMRANFVDTYGWDTGNQLALQLVTDALKLCPANPTFVEARDAILEADEILTGRANESDIWLAFAKRGMGYNASAPASNTTSGVVESYDLPPGVGPQPPTGVLKLSVTPPDRYSVLAGTNLPVYIRVLDGIAVTNATVTAKMNGTVDVPLTNTGTPPDARPGDSIYTGNLSVPANATNITLFIEASAPGKTNSTLNVNYFVTQPPLNDFFRSRIKLEAPGIARTYNNRFATTEPGEPAPAGISNFVASLWWTWTPTNDSRTLIDTAGSAFASTIAVYTGNSLTNLKAIKAVGSVPERKQSYMFFDAKKGETYQITVAGVSAANAGLLQLRVAPNGSPDITPPIISVARPASGYIWTNNVVEVIAQAVDPEPMATGVDQISFRVSPRQLGPATAVPALAGVSTNSVALVEGRNTITVTATDFAGNASSTNVMITFRRQEPPNDHFVNASLFQGLDSTNSVSNARATRENGEPRHASNAGGKSVWWRFRPPSDGVLLLSTEGSDFDTLMGLYTGDFVNVLTAVASNDDALEGSQFSKVRQAVRSSTTYYVAVDGFNAATGVVQLVHSFVPSTVYAVTLSQTAGGMVVPGAGVVDVEANSAIQLQAEPDSGFEFAQWEGDLTTSENPVSLPVNRDLSIRAVFRSRSMSDDFETGDAGRLPWLFSGQAPWYVAAGDAAGGNYALRSGQIGHSQMSVATLTDQFRAGLSSFAYRVSSEAGWDFLEFRVDGQLVQRWSGEVPWSTFEFTMTAGEHTLEWRYIKDPANSQGLDAAFLDNLALSLRIAPDGSQSSLAIGRATSGGVEIRLHGQTNQVYVIQAADAIGGRWRGIHTNQASGGEIRFVDPDSVTMPQRLYRGVGP